MRYIQEKNIRGVPVDYFVFDINNKSFKVPSIGFIVSIFGILSFIFICILMMIGSFK